MGALSSAGLVWDCTKLTIHGILSNGTVSGTFVVSYLFATCGSALSLDSSRVPVHRQPTASKQPRILAIGMEGMAHTCSGYQLLIRMQISLESSTVNLQSYLLSHYDPNHIPWVHNRLSVGAKILAKTNWASLHGIGGPGIELKTLVQLPGEDNCHYVHLPGTA